MRKLLLLIPLWLLVAQVLHAQCPTGTAGLFINLQSQAEVDAFAANYSGCSEPPGNLTIGRANGSTPTDITDISALSFITSVGKSFKISYNPQLTSLSGLENITIVGESLSVIGCSELEDLSGLGGIDSIAKNFIIGLNDKLKDISAMDGINSLNALIVDNNPELENLSGLEGLTTVRFNLIIQDNSKIKSLEGLDNLGTVGSQIQLKNNNVLNDISALGNLVDVGNAVTITGNPNLSACSIEPFCNELNSPQSAFFNVSSNASGCGSSFEIKSGCPPEAICKDVTVALQGDGSASINANTVNDGSIGVTSSSVSPSSFSCSDLGDNTVTLTVSNGNGDTDECTATVTVTLPTDLPWPWIATDIGDPGSGNSYNFDPCVAGPAEYTISADGYHLIPNTSDNMAFASLPLCGNGGIQARIESVEGGYAGLMIRESSAPGARMIGIYSNLTSLLRREVRYTDNGQNESNTTYASFPFMLRLVRNGDRINGFYKNGSKWIKFHQAELPMGDCVEMGLAVFSTNPFGTATATFDKVNFMSGMNLSAPNTGPIADALSDVQRARVSPNPTSGAFTLDFEQPLELEATAILLNELGQPLRQLQLPAGAINHSFDASNMPRGLYFLEVRDEQGYREVLKVVRQ
jgi:hypothetical protein